jgi:threonyl-tRNA synthetase
MTATDLELVLPDGSRLHVPQDATALAAAAQIGPRLASAALGATLDGEWVDLRAPLRRGGALRVITARDPEAGEVIRHSTEHVMADAVSRLWPGTQIDVGRSDHSEKFQYDLDVPVRLGPEDLRRIEAEMARIIAEDEPFTREVVSRDEARRLFAERGQKLKVSRIEDIPPDQEVTLFRHGSFVDLCRGPHVQRSSQIGAFELTELAGSYWRGDERNPMLQRIYGVSFATKAELEAQRLRIEEARRRDHRKLGAEFDLFLFHEWSPGSAFYLPKGLRLYQKLIDYVRGLYRKYGYDEVMCPQLFSAELFKTSGHYENFTDEMYWMPGAEAGEEIGLKPMNCPGHCLVFRSRMRSYRELPMRIAEFTRLHRNERSGTLHGMSRVRSFAQDDAHIFCEWDQVAKELDRMMEMIQEVYRDLGFHDVQVSVATRPERFIGEIEQWDRAERWLTDAVERAGFKCGIQAGQGAFYAPKIHCDFRDAIGRVWTLSTVQVDMAMPGRFSLRYVGSDGQEHEPAMLHRAILGSLERFIAVYLEHTAGDLPVWLAPVQVVVLPVSDRHLGYGREVLQQLCERGIDTELDARSETLGYRVRAGETQKIPYLLVVGDREEAERTVTVRRRHRKEQEAASVEQFCAAISEEIRTRGIS